MMFESVIHIDLPETGNPLAQLTSGEESEKLIVFNVAFESELSTRENANRDIRLPNLREAGV
jgi:hypothetical protein